MYNVSASDASSGSEKYDGKNSKFLSTSNPTLELRFMFSIYSPLICECIYTESFKKTKFIGII